MNDKRLIGICLIVLVLIAGGYLLFHKSSPAKPHAAQPIPAAAVYKGKLACDLFTFSQAQAIIGPDAKAMSARALGDRSTNDISITTCPYSTAGGSAADQASLKTASLLVHYAKNAAGQADNQKGFSDAQKLGTTTPVSGLGSQAFYSDNYGQLNVLQANYWLVSSVSTSDTSGLSHDQAAATKIIQDALPKL